MIRSLLPTIFALIALSACSPKPKVDEAAIFGAIRENLEAMQKEDLKAVMETVHPESGDLAKTRELIAEIFANYDLKYELSDLRVTDASDGKVNVTFTQRTKRTDGTQDDTENVVRGTHTLKQDGGRWKLLGTRAAPLEK
jgi:ketosteroid isomerase-like protein